MDGHDGRPGNRSDGAERAGRGGGDDAPGGELEFG